MNPVVDKVMRGAALDSARRQAWLDEQEKINQKRADAEVNWDAVMSRKEQASLYD
jgi:hypothetical protein